MSMAKAKNKYGEAVTCIRSGIFLWLLLLQQQRVLVSDNKASAVQGQSSCKLLYMKPNHLLLFHARSALAARLVALKRLHQLHNLCLCLLDQLRQSSLLAVHKKSQALHPISLKRGQVGQEAVWGCHFDSHTANASSYAIEPNIALLVDGKLFEAASC